jgi:hypothetical protein
MSKNTKEILAEMAFARQAKIASRAKAITTLDDIFNEVEAEADAVPRPAPLTPDELARQQAAQLAEDIRRGVRDEHGEWIEQPEGDEDEDEDETDE